MTHVRTVLEADGLLRIVLDRPQQKNALSYAMFGELAAAFNGADDRVRAALIEGRGGSFCAGADLADFASATSFGAEAPPARFVRALAAFDRPLVAQVEGHAVGVGATLLLHCDLVYAAPDARLAFPFVELGVVPEAGLSLLLPVLVGPRVAAELLLLGEPLSAERAKTLGIVNDVFPAAELASEVQRRVTRLLGLPPDAVRATKQLLRRPLAESLDDRLGAELELFGQRLLAPDTAARIRAILDRRRA